MQDYAIKITRCELKNILIDSKLQEAMSKELSAERSRREALLLAEAERESTIKIAEGKKQEAILAAEAEKTVRILEAEAAATAEIKRAEARAKAIELEGVAESNRIKVINEARASKETLQLKAMESIAKVADGQATKIFLPANMDILNTALTISETVKDNRNNNQQQNANKKEN